MTLYRTARVQSSSTHTGEDAHKEVRAYMPNNYAVVVTEHGTFVHGRDVAGWTMQDYVIPRLASGNIVAHEIRPNDEMFREIHRAMLVQLAREAAPEDYFEDIDGPGRYDGASDRELTVALEFLGSIGGFEDEAGEAESTGHFGRVGCAVLLTDSQGFLDATVLLDEDQAQKILDELDETDDDEIADHERRIAAAAQQGMAHGVRPQDGDPKPERTFAQADADRIFDAAEGEGRR